MSDPLGIVASSFTLLEVAQTIIKVRKAVKDAPEDWQQYKDKLLGLACLEKVLQATIVKYPDLRQLTVEDEDGEQHRFVLFIEKRVTTVREDASHLINRFDLGSANKKIGWLRLEVRKMFQRGRDVCSFLLSKEQIGDMIRDVEGAQHQLHMALTLASVSASASWQPTASELLANIKEELVNHGRTLEKLEDNSRLRRAVLEVNPEIIQHTAADPRTANDTPVVASGANATSLPSAKPNTSSVLEGVSRWFRKRGKRGSRHQNAAADGSATRQEAGGGGEGTYDADDESADDDSNSVVQPVDEQTITDATTQDPTGDVFASTANGGVEYALIQRGGILLHVPVDSEDYLSAVNPYQNPGGQPQDPPAAVRVEEVIGSMPAETWDEVKDKPFGELMDLVSSACATAYPTEAEEVIEESTEEGTDRGTNDLTDEFTEEDMDEGSDTGTEKGAEDDTDDGSDDDSDGGTDDSPITIDLQLPTHVFVAETVKLGRCKHITAPKLSFCVRDTSIHPAGQVFCVDEPCFLLYWAQQCNHVTLEIEGRPAQVSAVSSGSRLGLARLCRAGDISEDTARCVLPVKLFAYIADLEFTVEPEPDDDEFAFGLLRNVMSKEAVEIPPEVKWAPLIRFLALAHKYVAYVDDRPLQQARHWVTAFNPPSSFDQSALPWLWVLWKLHMVPEFKDLSAIVQQYAEAPVASWQDGPENVFGIKLPGDVVELLDQRRVETLSRVERLMTDEIERNQKRYLEASTQLEELYDERAQISREIFRSFELQQANDERHEAQQFEAPPESRSSESQSSPVLFRQFHDKEKILTATVMSSSCAFGYLKLERDRWLTPTGPWTHGGSDFVGTSFAEVYTASLRLIDLGKWKATTLSKADELDGVVTAVSALFPVIGAGLRTSSCGERLEGGFKTRLSTLVKELDKEDWGVSLTDISP